jgi:hypothetical protein
MPNVPAVEARQTDKILFIALQIGYATPVAVGDSARGVRLFQTERPIRVVQMDVHTSGTSTAGNTLRAAFGAYDASATPAAFTNFLGVASGLPTTNTLNNVPIESTSAADNTPLNVVPGNTWVGFNVPAVGTNQMTLIAARVVYRDA